MVSAAPARAPAPGSIQPLECTNQVLCLRAPLERKFTDPLGRGFVHITPPAVCGNDHSLHQALAPWVAGISKEGIDVLSVNSKFLFYLPPSHLLGVGGALAKDLYKAGLVRQSPPGPLPQPAKEEGHMVTTGQPFLLSGGTLSDHYTVICYIIYSGRRC